ncbi:hypothetical protein O181_114153 [Austropuccinia psidii MF-1]|uniref:Uncharacterized protein n=1 Tax=Austropuccinia psidii MF-1 TaxID=1389203 RepID=A0A9Q3K484_9BASI|nr:hypothetical protein [Austropuccinia psidii MF-1]
MIPSLKDLSVRKWQRRQCIPSSTGTGNRLELLRGCYGQLLGFWLGDGLTALFKAGLEWEGLGEAGGREVGMEARTHWKVLVVLGIAWLCNLLSRG